MLLCCVIILQSSPMHCTVHDVDDDDDDDVDDDDDDSDDVDDIFLL